MLFEGDVDLPERIEPWERSRQFEDMWRKLREEAYLRTLKNDPPFAGIQTYDINPRYLIVCVENPYGLPTLRELAEQAPTLGLRYIGTLGEELSRAEVRNGRMADELPHCFALLQILSGNEASALANIFRLECSLRTDKKLEPFTSVEPDYPLRYSVASKIGTHYDLRSSGSQHDNYCDLLKVNDAHSNGIKGDKVAVVVVDSGVEKAGIAAKFQDLCTGQNQSETDLNGHGTAMASIIHDIAPEATVTAIRISDGFPNMWRLMLGVSSASFGYQADIINISMGLDIQTTCLKCGAPAPGVSSTLEYFLRDISDKAISGNGPPLLVASTGNGALNEITCPAKWDFMVAVGAINAAKTRSRFSNYGDSTHSGFFVMPGGDDDDQEIPSEWIGAGDDAKCLGTSPATAYASAILALYYSDQQYRNSDRKQFLQDVLAKCDASFTGHDADQHGKGYLPYTP